MKKYLFITVGLGIVACQAPQEGDGTTSNF